MLSISLGANATHSVVYQNEEGKWVTDLAYYSSFVKEMDANMPEEVAMQFQSEDFIAGSKWNVLMLNENSIFGVPFLNWLSSAEHAKKNFF